MAELVEFQAEILEEYRCEYYIYYLHEQITKINKENAASY
jgi:hypothetical protein